jgi:hypothetical protein
MARKPVVDGEFYPADPQQLRAMIAAATPAVAERESALGLLSPHAGYVFSGGVVGRTFASVRVPRTVLLLTPSHSYDRPAFALWTAGGWETPLGEVALHEELTAALRKLPQVTADDRPHLREHSGEVVLPFVQYHNHQAKLAVICVTASASLDDLAAVGTAVPKALAESGEQDALVVASSDMSHESGRQALEIVNRNDLLAIAQMEKLDPEGLYRVCQRGGITMCGVLPAVAMMASVVARGGTKGKLIERATSADSPHGSGSYVVGYAGMLFQ